MIRTLSALLLLPALQPTSTGQENSYIQLQEIGGRTWLVAPSGKPFFAHGVTHLNGRHGEDVNAVANACQQLGFNAYGYGCPDPLKTDLPYVEGRNLIPSSLYRTTDGSFTYLDIFDPEQQTKLEWQVRKMCFANRDNPNLIGYCWTDLGAWPLKNTTGIKQGIFDRGLTPRSGLNQTIRSLNRYLIQKTPSG